jgi:hypothetical protein
VRDEAWQEAPRATVERAQSDGEDEEDRQERGLEVRKREER